MKKLLIAGILAATLSTAAVAEFGPLNRNGVSISPALSGSTEFAVIELYDGQVHTSLAVMASTADKSVCDDGGSTVLVINGVKVSVATIRVNKLQCMYAATSEAGRKYINDQFRTKMMVLFNGVKIPAKGWVKAEAALLDDTPAL